MAHAMLTQTGRVGLRRGPANLPAALWVRFGGPGRG